MRIENYNTGPLRVESLGLLPFQTFILKIHERCNLQCDYCYVYQLGDQSWRSRPPVMPITVIDELALRIGEHVADYAIPEVNIVLHGGEPLLAGADTIAYALHSVRRAVGHGCRTRFSIQTNGLLLDENYLRLFEELDVRVGLSLDGDEQMHDRHRRRADGRGSYSEAAATAALLSQHPRLFSGILSVIDLRNDPVRAYEALARFSPPVIDFLLPHGNWSAPPPGRRATDDTPYGDWLVAAFDHWYHSDGSTGVRLFEEILSLLLGGSSSVEEIGLSPVTVVVVESNGDTALSDVLNTSAGRTGLNVATDAFAAALRLPQAAAGQARAASLAVECKACPVAAVCGGGLYAHRYRAANGFDNPSVYCADLYRLITHIRDRVSADLPRVTNGD